VLSLGPDDKVDIKWGAKNEDGRLSDQTCKVRPRFRARVRVRLPPAAYPSPDTNPNPNPITLTTYYLDRGERARAALRGVEGQPRRHQVRAHAAGAHAPAVLMGGRGLHHMQPCCNLM